MPEAAPAMEEVAVANGGGASAPDVAAPAKKDNSKKEVPAESKDVVAENKSAEEQNKGSENGTKGLSDGDVKMVEAEDAKEDDAVGAKQAGTEDVKLDSVEDADAKEDKNAKDKECEDAKMTEAEAGNAGLEDEGKEEDNDLDKEKPRDAKQIGSDKQEESKEQEKSCSSEHEEKKEKEESPAENEEEEEEEEKGSADMKVEGENKKANSNEEKLENDGSKKHENDGEATDEQDSESDKKMEENKEETPKNKKARSARDRSQGKDKKQDGSKSREAKSLLNTPSPYGTDRPQRERKTVERLVEVIEKEPNKNFVVEKGRGTPLKDIPSVAHRISRKKPAELKFLHNVLFGRKGKTVDFKGHILQFSGFVWHESDEKQRAKAKEKLDKCVKDMLLDLCWLLAIPFPKTNIRKEDIVAKLLDFIAEPHAINDSGLSDDQGSNRKRKRSGSVSKTPDGTPKRPKKKFGDDATPSKKQKKALEYDTDENEEDEDQPMKSDSEEDNDEGTDGAADEQEDDYDSAKEKAAKKSSEVKVFSGKKKVATGSDHKTGPLKSTSKSPGKISKEKDSLNDNTKVFSRKKKPVAPKHAPSSEKDIKEKKSSGKKVTKGKVESTEPGLPSKDELRKTIVEILKKVDFNTATFSDILKKLDNHYKIDLTPRKAAIKLMIQEELTKLSEADEDEDGNEDSEEKQPRRQAKKVVA